MLMSSVVAVCPWNAGIHAYPSRCVVMATTSPSRCLASHYSFHIESTLSLSLISPPHVLAVLLHAASGACLNAGAVAATLIQDLCRSSSPAILEARESGSEAGPPGSRASRTNSRPLRESAASVPHTHFRTDTCPPLQLNKASRLVCN